MKIARDCCVSGEVSGGAAPPPQGREFLFFFFLGTLQNRGRILDQYFFGVVVPYEYAKNILERWDTHAGPKRVQKSAPARPETLSRPTASIQRRPSG